MVARTPLTRARLAPGFHDGIFPRGFALKHSELRSASIIITLNIIPFRIVAFAFTLFFLYVNQSPKS